MLKYMCPSFEFVENAQFSGVIFYISIIGFFVL